MLSRVMCGRIADRCARVCLRVEALWRLQPAAAASARCIATIGPFSQTNGPRQRAQTETACMQITELLFTGTIFEGVSPQRSNLRHVAHRKTKSQSQQGARGGPSSSSFWGRRGPSRWGEGERDVGKGVTLTSSLQGQTDLWNFAWPPKLSYFWWRSFHQVGPTKVFSSSFSFSPSIFHSKIQSVCLWWERFYSISHLWRSFKSWSRVILLNLLIPHVLEHAAVWIHVWFVLSFVRCKRIWKLKNWSGLLRPQQKNKTKLNYRE